MLRAGIAGTLIAASCGAVGYFVVLRSQVFIGDALGHAAFTGALAALAGGFDIRLGLFVVTIGVAMAMGATGRFGTANDTSIGIVFVFVLGLGVLFLGLFTSGSSGANGSAGISILFGSLFGLSRNDVWVAGGASVIVLGGTLAIARPLLFASVSPAVAQAQGVPVRALGVASLALIGTTAAVATQAVGALLLLGLLAAPAAASIRISSRPYTGLAISVALAIAIVWIGIGLSVGIPKVPLTFWIMMTAAGMHAGSYLLPRARVRR